MTDDDATKVEILQSTFQILKNNPIDNRDSLASIIAQLNELDSWKAADQLEKLLDPNKKILHTNKFFLYAFTNKLQRIKGIDEAYSFLSAHQNLWKYFYLECCCPSFFATEIRKAVIKDDLSFASEALKMAFKNKHLEESKFEIINIAIPNEKAVVSEAAYSLLSQYTNKVSDPVENAKLKVKLLGLTVIDLEKEFSSKRATNPAKYNTGMDNVYYPPIFSEKGIRIFCLQHWEYDKVCNSFTFNFWIENKSSQEIEIVLTDIYRNNQQIDFKYSIYRECSINETTKSLGKFHSKTCECSQYHLFWSEEDFGKVHNMSACIEILDKNSMLLYKTNRFSFLFDNAINAWTYNLHNIVKKKEEILFEAYKIDLVMKIEETIVCENGTFVCLYFENYGYDKLSLCDECFRINSKISLYVRELFTILPLQSKRYIYHICSSDFSTASINIGIRNNLNKCIFRFKEYTIMNN